MAAFMDRLAREFPATNAGWSAAIVPLLHSELGRTRQGLLVLLGAGISFLVEETRGQNVHHRLRASRRGRETAPRMSPGES